MPRKTNALLDSFGTLKAHQPSLRERSVNALRQALFSDDRAGQGQAENLMSYLDYTPVGAATAMYDAGRSGAEGDWLGAGLNTAMAGVPAPARKGIRAFHGSPHDFDRFDMSKIGTGEGAQAYGHGLYFAENEGIAKSYRDALREENLTPAQAMATNTLRTPAYGRDKGIAYLKAQLNRGYNELPEQSRKEYEEAIQLLESGWEAPEGRMYEVSIAADPEEFLDWDKKVRDMPPEMQQTVLGLPGSQEGDLGSQIYHRRVDEFGQGAATDQLRAAGIPGIKYLDAGSRGEADRVGMLERKLTKLRADNAPAEDIGLWEHELGLARKQLTNNYVLFDDKLIDIIRKYGIAGLTTLGAGGNVLQQYSDSEQQ